jgi:hypothetical protein
MRVNIGVYNLVTGNRIAVTRDVKLKKFRKMILSQRWTGKVEPLPLTWIKGDFRAHAYFTVEPCLVDPCKMGAYFSGVDYE